MFYWQDLDLEKAVWTSTIGSFDKGMIWNTFDLNSGIWDQEFFSGGELKWTDKFNTSGTIWNYAKPILAVK